LTINHLFAGMAVTDYEAALAWYQRLFGRPPDVIVTDHEAMWQIAAAWVYVVRDPARAGSALLTLLVDNLAAQVAELGERGLATSPIETVPGLYRKAVLSDPAGNTISFGENLNTSA
jgi:predicted enzyme related to lactoylglutathione lyase